MWEARVIEVVLAHTKLAKQDFRICAGAEQLSWVALALGTKGISKVHTIRALPFPRRRTLECSQPVESSALVGNHNYAELNSSRLIPW